MTQTSASPRRRGVRRGLAVLGLALGLTSVSAASFSLALFTSSTNVSANAFSTGTVILTTDKAASALIGFTNMLPGDSVTAPLLISNTGTGALRYSMTTTVSGETKGLGSQLQVKTLGTGCGTFDGTLLYGNIDPTLITAPATIEALTKPIKLAFLGDAAEGNQAGDRVLAGSDNAAPVVIGSASRANAASGSNPTSETLCFRAYLPKYATGDAFQGAAVTASFAFVAEQNANNP